MYDLQKFISPLWAMYKVDFENGEDIGKHDKENTKSVVVFYFRRKVQLRTLKI